MNPRLISRFLSSKTIAVAGVSRDPHQAANAVFNRLKSHGYRVYPVNPFADSIKGERCYPDIRSLPENVEAVMVMTHPGKSADLVRQCADAGVDIVWLHRSFGGGSVSDAAVEECRKRNISSIVGGCPMMYLERVDFGHRCLRWILGLQGKLPEDHT